MTKRSTNAINKVRMHIITVSVTVSLLKIQRLMNIKKGLLTELEKNKKIKKNDSQKEDNIFWVVPVLDG